MFKIIATLSLLLFLFALCSCNTDYYSISTYSENGFVNAVIEIPAGTNHKIEYSKEENTFKNDVKNGEERIINFLPYPTNYGFIPSTLMDTDQGGDGDPLDIIVIGESAETGTVIQITPIGMIELYDKGELDNKLLAIPAEESHKIVDVKSLNQLKTMHPEILNIIETWFLNYKGKGIMESGGWKDEKAAFAEIDKWTIK